MSADGVGKLTGSASALGFKVGCEVHGVYSSVTLNTTPALRTNKFQLFAKNEP